ncbi:MAG: hypothetical protein KIT36_09645 [Alphaproteobacteria bacterium]|nr:hypothetical protein [Alphaproteobacteria bacterium]
MAGRRAFRAVIGGALALAAGLVVAPVRADYQSTMEALTRGLPRDASALVYRIVGCNHWGGEEPYDDARKAEIDKAMRELDCDRLDRDEADLRRRHAGDPAVLKALDQAKELAF